MPALSKATKGSWSSFSPNRSQNFRWTSRSAAPCDGDCFGSYQIASTLCGEVALEHNLLEDEFVAAGAIVGLHVLQDMIEVVGVRAAVSPSTPGSNSRTSAAVPHPETQPGLPKQMLLFVFASPAYAQLNWLWNGLSTKPPWSFGPRRKKMCFRSCPAKAAHTTDAEILCELASKRETAQHRPRRVEVVALVPRVHQDARLPQVGARPALLVSIVELGDLAVHREAAAEAPGLAAAAAAAAATAAAAVAAAAAAAAALAAPAARPCTQSAALGAAVLLKVKLEARPVAVGDRAAAEAVEQVGVAGGIALEIGRGGRRRGRGWRRRRRRR